MNNLKVTLIQHDIAWENTDTNLLKLDKLFNEVEKDVDLVVLPEMFHSGFTMHPETVAEEMDGPVLKWMKAKAMEKQICLIGSVVFGEDSKYYNRLFIYYPDGNYLYYDKRHLFSMGGEGQHYQQGNKRLIFEYKGWKICPLVCYDLRFPVWSSNQNEYDLLIYVANWPTPRRKVWQILLQARAIENQSYVIGVNRVGKDVSAYYSGDSVVLDAKGNTLVECVPEEEEIKTIVINKDDLEVFRKKFPVLNDRDDFILQH
nr:amidohydrolase [uncultured Carboxylicivirga sp.]